MIPGALVLSHYILSKWTYSKFQILVISIALILNIGSNFEELRFKARKVMSSSELFQKLKITIPDVDGLTGIGILNRDARFLFWGRYFLGEEISRVNDKYLPLLLFVKDETDLKLSNYTYVKNYYPTELSDTTSGDAQLKFIQHHRIGVVVIPNKDQEKFNWINKIPAQIITNPTLHLRYYIISK